jgi:hypothetical protein
LNAPHEISDLSPNEPWLPGHRTDEFRRASILTWGVWYRGVAQDATQLSKPSTPRPDRNSEGSNRTAPTNIKQKELRSSTFFKQNTD